jgi:hypothetical protein
MPHEGEPGQRCLRAGGEGAGRMALVPIDCDGLGRRRVEQQDTDLAPARRRAGEDGGHVVVGGVAILGHAVQP